MSDCYQCTVGVSQTDGTCPATGFQKVDVCVPVVVTPFARTGTVVTKCCGDPVVTPGDTPCPGRKNGACAFTIRQTICVEVPVNFGANAAVGDVFVNCKDASAEDICRKCDKED